MPGNVTGASRGCQVPNSSRANLNSGRVGANVDVGADALRDGQEAQALVAVCSGGGFRQYLDYANGTLGDWGIHWFDQILWITGEK